MRENENNLPVSDQQLGMLIELSLGGNRKKYHIAKAIKVHSQLDLDNLKNAFKLLLERQLALSTVFFQNGAEWRCAIQPSMNAYSTLEIEEKKVEDFFNEELNVPFDILNGPLFKFFHIRTESLDYIFLHAHHLITDLWSIGLFLEELFSLYRHQKISTLDVQYTDYSLMQSRQPNPPKKVLEYWEKLSNQHAVNSGEVEGDLSNCEADSGTIEILPFSLSNTVAKQIYSITRTHRIRPVSFFFSIYSHLLFLITGGSNHYFGTTTHGRKEAKTYRTMGLFSTPIPIFSSILQGPSFIEHAKAMQKQLINSTKRNLLPFFQLSQNVSLFKNQHADGIFKNMFVFQQVPAVSGELKKLSLPSTDCQKIFWNDLTLSSSNWSYPFSPFDFSIYLNEVDGAFKGFVEFNSAVYSRKKIESILTLFEQLSNALSRTPDQSIYDFKAPYTPLTVDSSRPSITIGDAFTQIASKSPGSIVAYSHSGMLTYETLDKLSNQYARYMLSKGIFSDQPVAVQMDYCFETLIVILAIWKIGAILIPIDITTYPRKKQLILEDCQPSSFIQDFSFDLIESFSNEALPVLASPKSIAYILYTSGSTGKPKGVAISHDSLLSYIDSIDQDYSFDQSNHFPLYSSFSFDLTMTSLCYPLFKGGALHLYERQYNIHTTLEQVFHNPLITHLKCTPSHLKLVEWIDASTSFIEVIIAGGEQATRGHLSLAVKSFPQFKEFINEYGPTESTVGCIAYKTKNKTHSKIIPIGQPLRNSYSLFLGPSYEYYPYSNQDELLIGGKGLAYGYWNNAKLTAEKFIPDPFHHSARLYKTGDECKVIDCSDLIFCNRSDEQVKILGYRIDLSEIEEVIKEHKSIFDAKVRYLENGLTPYLVAYVASTQSIDSQEIIEFSRAQLPHYMVPKHLVKCDSIPINSNGKVDYSQLPQPNIDKPTSIDWKAKDDLSRAFTQVLSDILNIDPNAIQPNDSFFSLGGDSIKAIQLASIARQKGWHIQVSDLLSGKPFSKLLLHCKQGPKHKTSTPKGFDKSLPMTFMQQWFLNTIQHNPDYYHQAVQLVSSKRIDFQQIKGSITQAIQEQPLMQYSLAANKDALEKIAAKDVLEICQHDLKKHSNPISYINKQTQKSVLAISLKEGPLVHVSHFCLEDKDILIIVTHHLIIDGVSWNLFLQAIDGYYSGNRIPLPIETVHRYMSDYVSYCNKFKNSEIIPPEKTYPFFNQKNAVLNLNPTKTENLISQVGIKNLEAMLLALFLKSAQHIFEKSYLSILIEGHGRNFEKGQEAFSYLVGWFTNLKTLAICKDHGSLIEYYNAIKSNSKIVEKKLAQADILFNFLGEMDSNAYENFSFSPIWENLTDSRNTIPYPLTINAIINSKELQLHIAYDSATISSDQIKTALDSFETQCEIKQLPNKEELAHKVDFNLTVSDDDWASLKRQIKHQPSIPLKSIETISPLLPSQKGIYLHSIQNPLDSSYFQQVILRFDGVIKEQTALKAFSECLKIYPSLRTRFFHNEMSQPLKVVLNQIMPHFVKTQSSLEEYLKADKNNQFVFSKGPLIRMGLVEEDHSFTIVLTYHHLIMDGWSLSNFFQTFLTRLEGKQVPIEAMEPILPLNARPLESELAYWHKLLEGISKPSHLPRAIQAADQKASMNCVKHDFTQQAKAGLEEIAKLHSTSLSAILHSLWAFLISCYSGTHDVIFGTVTSGRSRMNQDLSLDVDQLSYTVPIRVKIDGSQSIIELSQTLQQQLNESSEKNSLSTGEIQSISELNRDLFDHIFVMENYPFSGKAEELVKSYDLPISLKSASIIELSHFPFALSFLPSEKLEMEIQFDQNAFSIEYIHSICSGFETLIGIVLQSPQIKLRNLTFSKAQHSLQTEISKEKNTILEEFYENAQKTPHKIALVHGCHNLSFEQLERMSRRTANFLLMNGLKQEEPVGIQYSKSIAWVIAWLGIMRAGGTSVPISCNAPPQRLQSVVEQTNMKMLLSDQMIPKKETLSIIPWRQLQRKLESVLCLKLPRLPAEQQAYILFTSGSTGEPKGISVPHSALMNHYHWTQESFYLGPEDRMLQLTALTFDVSICELYGFIAGGTVVLPEFEKYQDLEKIIQAVELNHITFMQMVPSLFETLLNQTVMNRLNSVRQVLCGADILKPQHVKKWFELSNIPLTNLYGLTETCIDSTFYHCQRGRVIGSMIPIGSAIYNTSLYILDKHYNSLPMFSIGTLYIGGKGLGRGYYNKPSLTALSYLPSPFEDGQRIFDTHDKVTYSSSTDFLYVGRSDNQVKIRGLRIELDEITSILCHHPSIEKAFVKVINPDSHPSLCAYYTAKYEINYHDIQSYLGKRLPSYMIPSHFLYLTQFPTTQHGKIDSQSLPHPTSSNEKYIHENTLEKELSHIWSKFLKLKVDEIDPTRNFFDQGGNSLSLMQIHQVISKTYTIQIQIADLFEYTTIRSLANYIRQNNQSSNDSTTWKNRHEKRKQRQKRQKMR